MPDCLLASIAKGQGTLLSVSYVFNLSAKSHLFHVLFNEQSVITIKFFLGYSKKKTKKSTSETRLQAFPRILPFKGMLIYLLDTLADVKRQDSAQQNVP